MEGTDVARAEEGTRSGLVPSRLEAAGVSPVDFRFGRFAGVRGRVFLSAVLWTAARGGPVDGDWRCVSVDRLDGGRLFDFTRRNGQLDGYARSPADLAFRADPAAVGFDQALDDR